MGIGRLLVGQPAAEALPGLALVAARGDGPVEGLRSYRSGWTERVGPRIGAAVLGLPPSL
jgi:hypothetical protein